MKNKLLKGAHLSEKKCREILQLFCDDLTATQIAEVSGVSRVTVNNYFRRIRSIIAGFCEQNHQPGNVTIDGSAKNANECLNGYYGFYVNQGKIGTTWLDNFCEHALKQLTESKNEEETLMHSILGCQAIADCNDWKLYWVRGGNRLSATHNLDIAGFWAHTKGRLQKFRGLNKNTLYFHIKECEFRYNFRHGDVLSVLSDIINNNKQYMPCDIKSEYILSQKKVAFRI